MKEKLRSYIASFGAWDSELYPQLISNADAERFLEEQIPLLDCPDRELERMYYFRWWTFRKHIKQTEKGHIITEFLPEVPWSGPCNSIVCPVGFHLREGRWLKDPEGWVREYILFWLDGHGNAHDYSSWLPYAVWEYCSVKQDWDLAVESLPKLVDFFERREETHLRRCGLYWSGDDRDGMEYSVSGSGFRPTLNSYAFGDALAISRIAGLAGDKALQARFADKAAKLKEAAERFLWDGDFYKTIPMEEQQDPALAERPPVEASNNVRELAGYIPWYFLLPDQGKEAAFLQLKDPEGFLAAAGLTTAEQRHCRFMERHAHECLWNGPVWPFATSQVLVAAANLLREYDQTVLRKDDYYALLLQYAKSQHRTTQAGITVPWIDENLDPHSGQWLARDILESWGWKRELGGYERGKDYNHSLFCDLVLSGLLGIRVENGHFAASPLIPDSWDYFSVENLWLKGKAYRIAYDKDGTHYGLGAGLSIRRME